MSEDYRLINKTGTIVCGFFGIGKSSVPKYRPDVKFYDLDANSFIKKKGWEKLYVDCALALSKEYDVVAIKSSDKVMKLLNQMGKKYYLVYPSKYMKRDFIERAINNGYSRDFIEKFFMAWDKYIDEVENEDCENKIVLQSREYLSDIIDRILRFKI